MGYIKRYIERIKDTKKLARERNVPVWHVPLINAIGLVILTAVYGAIWSWTLVVEIENSFVYVPSWWNHLLTVSGALPYIYFGVIMLTMLDKILILFILFQAAIAKSIMHLISKADHKIWRKTGRDSFITNKIWWVQQKWLGIPKKKRKRITAILIFCAIVYYGWLFTS